MNTNRCPIVTPDPEGHEGPHEDGALSWEDADESEAVTTDHTAAIIQALSCLDDHTRTDSARMEGARVVLRGTLGVRQPPG